MLQRADAQSLSTSVIERTDSDKATPPQQKMTFGLTGLGYVSDSSTDQSAQGQAEFSLSLKKEGFFFSGLEVTAGTFTEPRSTYIPVPEAYLAVGSEKENFAAVGIKSQSYSFIDRYYNLGMYQSYYTNDFINYKEQGFTGLQVQLRSGLLGFKGGYQPIFLKNQGPSVYEKDGQLVTSNRWARRPPKQFEFVEGQVKDIEYDIRNDDVAQIITNQGHTLSFFLGENAERPWFQASYARHPLNEIPLSRETYGSIGDFRGHVLLSPVVTDHEVKSADFNLDSGPFESTLSYLEDQPQNSEPRPDETLQVFNPLKVYGVYIAVELKELFNRPLKISFSAAEMQGGEIKEVMQGGKESLFIFASERTIFKRPISLGATGEFLYIGSKPLRTSVQWTYDRAHQGSLISTKLAHETWKQVYLHGGFDLLGVENEPSVDAQANHLSRNQANDRFFAGVQYVY